jgi:hypothetical protein
VPPEELTSPAREQGHFHMPYETQVHNNPDVVIAIVVMVASGSALT